MRILLVTQNFPPETGAVANRLFELSTRLRLKGAEITVLAPMPNYPFGRVFEEYRGKWSVEERVGDLGVVRSWIYVRTTKSILQRLLTYFSFVFSSLAVGLTIRRHFDCVFLDAPPLFLGMSAYVLKLLHRARFVVNMSDLWPESAEKLGLVTNRLLLDLVRRLETFLYRKADLITGQTQGIVASIAERHPDKTVLWLKNGVDLTFYDHSAQVPDWRRENGYADDDFVALFAGLIGHAQGCEVLVHAANELRDLPQIQLCIVGDGPRKEACVELKERYGLSNVRFFPVQPKARMPEIISAADASIIPLRRLDLFLGAIPSKIFEHLAMKKPILLGLEGEARTLFVEQARAGLAFEPENPADLAAQLRELYSNRDLARELGENGLVFVRDHFNRDQIADELWEALRTGIQR